MPPFGAEKKRQRALSILENVGAAANPGESILEAIRILAVLAGRVEGRGDPRYRATVQVDLGNAYYALSEVRDREANCRSAVEAYQKALRSYAADSPPGGHSRVQHNLGKTYLALADYGRAVESFQNAIRTSPAGRDSHDSFLDRYYLGRACTALAGVRDREENCRRAIEALQEALRIRRTLGFPGWEAWTQYYLGNAYLALAEAREPEENRRRAARAYEAALGIFTPEEHSDGHAKARGKLEEARRARK